MIDKKVGIFRPLATAPLFSYFLGLGHGRNGKIRTCAVTITLSMSLFGFSGLVDASSSFPAYFKRYMANGGWMEHTAGRALMFIDSASEMPQLSCGKLPVKSFVPHASIPNNWSYDCLGDAWGPHWVWLNKKFYCPKGYTMISRRCIATGTPIPIRNQRGGVCPTGNPINTASGNKYQKEVDFKGKGTHAYSGAI